MRLGRLGASAAAAAARSAPLSAFFAVYVVTCWIGGVALLLGPDSVRESYVYSSGARIGHLSSPEVTRALVLLTIAPLLLWAGWTAAGRLTKRWGPTERAAGAARAPRGLAIGVIAVFGYLLLRLTLADAPQHVDAWFNYDNFIAQRSRLFDDLGFADFVLAYTGAPVLAGAYLAARLGDGTRARNVAVAAIVLFALLATISLLLFQKRPLFVYLLVVGTIIAAHAPARERLHPLTSRRGVRWALVVAATAYAIYLVLLVAPVVSSESDAADPAPAGIWTFQDGAGPWGGAGPFVAPGAKVGPGPGASGRGLAIETTRAGQGASLATGIPGAAKAIWHVSAQARSDTRATIRLAVGSGPADHATARLPTGPRWAPVDVAWLERADTASVVIGAKGDRATRYGLDDVRIDRTYAGRPPGPRQRSVLAQSRFDTDRSGWQGTPGADLNTVPGRFGRALRVDTRVPGAGASLDLGDPAPEGLVAATLWVRAPQPLAVSLGDPARAVRVAGGPRWRRLVVRGTARGGRPTLRVRARRPGVFFLDEVRVTGRRRAAPARPVAPQSAPEPPAGGVTFPRNEDLAARSAGSALLFYALLAPFVRTSGPAVAYPSFFPARHGYFRLDLGLDVLGFGAAPDDNQVSFDLMYPDAAHGQNSVPFAFTLYSQGGLAVALLGALIVGLLWRLAWWLGTTRIPAPLGRAVVAALIIIFGVYIAGDSGRNALLASYGVIWPLLGTGAVGLVLAAAPRLGALGPRRTATGRRRS
jgi:hypothetical protein